MAASEVSSSAFGRRPLSLKALISLEPREAAAYLVVRRSEGLTGREQGVLADWLAADASHRQALVDAEHVWRLFDEPGDNAILAAMRTDAMASRPRTGFGWLSNLLQRALDRLYDLH